MKALTIIMATMAASVMVMGQPDATTTTNTMVPTDKQIQEAITNGTVCRVRGGHLWKDKWSGMERGWEPDGRQCEICNKYQKRKETWEDE